MDVSLNIIILCYVVIYGEAVPPEVCFQPFKWEDCGRPPVHVLYYYKPGSRCEVGIWRGCLPNLNMFKDEYECVNTCIYSERARPEDFHKDPDVKENTIDELYEDTSKVTDQTVPVMIDDSTQRGNSSEDGSNKGDEATKGGDVDANSEPTSAPDASSPDGAAPDGGPSPDTASTTPVSEVAAE